MIWSPSGSRKCLSVLVGGKLDPDPSELAVPIQIRYSSFEVLGWHSIGTLVFSESTRDPIPPIDGREQYHSQSTSIRDVGGIVMRQC